MKWRCTAGEWKQRFAIIPICVGGHWYWLEWYWTRFCGLYFQTVIGKGRDALAAALKQEVE